jgi:hypothetical protein
VLAIWLLLCDAGLKFAARVGGCGGFSMDLLTKLYEAPTQCKGSDMAGAAIRLQPAVNDGALLGLGAGTFAGFTGQLFALGLIALATIATIAVLRWQWRSSGDPKALAAIWAGALILAVPRLIGSGSGLAELDISGLSAGIGDLALLWGLAWIVGRFVGERRA